MMRICRFIAGDHTIRIGFAGPQGEVVDLTPAGVKTMHDVLSHDRPSEMLHGLPLGSLPTVRAADVTFRPPVEKHEVWAAGVTYLRSKAARMEESDFSATAYDRVYEAERPEIFFKSMAEKVVASGEAVGIRRDASWNVPEPELALVLNPRGAVVGLTLGNDMSSRDIEGENLLYLPQAKIYERSCALGPWILLGASEADARRWSIRITITRNGQVAFAGETSIANIQRRFHDLAEFLFRCQRFDHGAVLLTGTGIVPPEAFTLQERDEIEIEIPEIGVLRNPVITV
jgi:2-dehydro-3-deoxy-D-arabinonate dehydratase